MPVPTGSITDFVGTLRQEASVEEINAAFKAAASGGAMPLVAVGVLASAVAAYFYVRVIVLMFFTEAPADPPVLVRPSWTTAATVALTAGITFALGALPQPLLDLADSATGFLR